MRKKNGELSFKGMKCRYGQKALGCRCSLESQEPKAQPIKVSVCLVVVTTEITETLGYVFSAVHLLILLMMVMAAGDRFWLANQIRADVMFPTEAGQLPPRDITWQPSPHALLSDLLMGREGSSPSSRHHLHLSQEYVGGTA
jgi:hypothetical protein